MVSIRAAAPGEEEALLPLFGWLFAPPGRQPAQWDEGRARAAVEATIAGERSELFVAEEDGEVVGICTVYLDLISVRYGQRAWVEDLAVHPDRRSRGIGKALLDAAKGWARERGATHLELDSGDARTDAHRFYERERPSWTARQFAWEL
jgi:GNAT superfamily N-acetyltransferase